MSSQPITPTPPTIPPDDEFSVNATRLQKITQTLESPIIMVPNSSSYSILEGGTLSGLNDPVENQQASTLAYAIANLGGATPGGPVTSVQYNDGGSFGGSSDLLYNDVLKKLTAKTLTNGTVTIGSGTISGLSSAPTQGDQAATKGYAENSFTITSTTNNTVGIVTYTASQMMNGIISRNITGAGTTIVDRTATAADIIAFGGEVGTTYHFIIKNTSTDLNSIIQLNAASTPSGSMNTGMSIRSNTTQNIYPGYQYTGLLKITGLTTVEIITLNNNRALINENFNYRFNKSFANLGVMQCTDYLLEWTLPYSSTLTISQYIGGNYGIVVSYTNMIKQKVLKTQVITGNTVNGSTTTNRLIFEDIPYDQFKTGSIEFYLANPLASSFNAVIDFTKPGFGNYTQDPYSIYEIEPGQTGWFLLRWDATLEAGYIYSLGFFDTVA